MGRRMRGEQGQRMKCIRADDPLNLPDPVGSEVMERS